MKRCRKLLIAFVLALSAALCALFVGCGGGEITVTLHTYDEQTQTVSGAPGETIAFPDVTREGYVFDGWYASEDLSGTPVENAVFSQDTTDYYAKWSVAYTLTLDLGGGTLAAGQQTAIPLRAGTLLNSALSGYAPVLGDARFAGWYMDGELVTATDTMPAEALTLTAAYEAAYTVDVYLADDEAAGGYELKEAYASGYATVGEEFTPEIEIEGFMPAGTEGDVESLVISSDASKNVFKLHFDPAIYRLYLNSNRPDGTGTTTQEQHRAGEAFDLPVLESDMEGYRFLGWAESADASCEEAVSGKGYQLSGDTVLYAVWNRAYTDLFNGEDLIFLNYDEENTAVLSRGGVDISGEYVERNGCYVFRGDGDYMLYAMLNDTNHTFIYYSDRSGVYMEYVTGTVNTKTTVTLDRFNGITLSREGGLLQGTYLITEDGYYVATFEDGSSFTFLLGTVTTVDGTTQAVYMVRGGEAAYGEMPMNGMYYPTITLDGFGYATLTAATGETESCLYRLDADDPSLFTLYTASGQLVGTFGIFDYGNGLYGFETYTEELDRNFIDTGSLTLDGCSNATFVSNALSFTGSYVAVASQRGGYIISVTTDDGTGYRFRVWTEQSVIGAMNRYEMLGLGYTEYVYCSEEGELGTVLMVENGDGTATLYEVNPDKTALDPICSGTFEEAGGYFLFTVDKNGTVEWAQTQISSMLVNIDLMVEGTTVNLYYVLTSTANDAEGTQTDYRVIYEGADGSTLIFVSAYAIYVSEDGTVSSGMRAEYANYVQVNAGSKTLYFEIDEQNKTFEQLNSAPLILTKRVDGATVNDATLSITGKTLGENRFEAVYITETANIRGYYTEQFVSAPGFGDGIAFYTFTADDGSLSFCFTLATSGSNVYFNYYDVGEDAEIVTFTAADTEGVEDKTLELTLLISGGRCVLVYADLDAETSLRGTFKQETVDAFGSDIFVYTFLPEGEGETFRFTLVSGTGGTYFRISEPAAIYTADGGTGRLELNGDTLAAQYTAENGSVYFGIYTRTENVLDGSMNAVCLMLEDRTIYFDIDGTVYTIRGDEAASYFVFENGIPAGYTVTLDGYGGATVTIPAEEEEAEDTVLTGDYVLNDGICAIAILDGETSYVGKLGVYGISGVYYNAFYLQNEQIADAYLDRTDLSVLVLDDIGNVTKYNAYGQVVQGIYTVLEDNIFYYSDSEQTEAAMYTISADGNTIVPADYSAIYYAEDLASVIFYRNGVVLFNNNESAYFTYDEATGAIAVYTYAESGGNAYGFVKTILDLKDGVLTYTDKTSSIRRTYTQYEAGRYVTLTDNAGGVLEFIPDGASFTVEATYTPADGKALSRYVILSYDESGKTELVLAYNAQLPIRGSSNGYVFTATNPLTVSYTDTTYGGTAYDGTFSLGEKDTFNLTLYEYNYVAAYIAYYDYFGESTALLFEPMFAALSVQAVQNGDTFDYTVSGQFNFIDGAEEDEPLTFTDGKLSYAGYANQTYGHMFTLAFTGSDGALYHMNFYATYNEYGIYCCVIYSLTRATQLYSLADGTVIYGEEFLYSAFKVVKETDEITGEEVYFEEGDEFYPSIAYRGEVTNVATYTEKDGEWTFVSFVYDGGYLEYEYVFSFTEEAGEIVSGSLSARTTASCLNGEYDTVYFVYDMDTGEIIEVYALVINEVEIRAESCVKEEDGSFTVVITDPITEEKAAYTVVFTETETPAEDGTTVTVGGKTYTVSLEKTELPAEDAEGEPEQAA